MQGVCRDVSRHAGSGTDDPRTPESNRAYCVCMRMVRDRCANRNHKHYHWRQVRVFLPRGALVLPLPSRVAAAVSDDDALSYAAVSSWPRCNAITNELTPQRSPSCQNPALGEACTHTHGSDEQDCTFVSLQSSTCACDYTAPVDPYPYDPSFGSWYHLQTDWRTLVEGSQACAPDPYPSTSRLLAPPFTE
eukprot:COSAG02_NODE_536_length_20657_cov_91.744041_16_plen_191_part_00